ARCCCVIDWQQEVRGLFLWSAKRRTKPLSLETDGNIRSGTAWTRWMNVERSIMHSNSQLTDCFVSLALRRAAHDCITGDGSSGAALRLCYVQLDIFPAN